MSSVRDLTLRLRGKSDLRDMTRGTSRQLGSVAKEAGKAGDKAGSDFTEGFKSRIVGRIAGIVTAGFALAKVGDVAKFGLEVASQNEQAQISFTTLLKSGSKAKAFIGDLQRFAAKTPFDFPGLQQSASQLLAAGINSKKIIPIMTTLGNVTSGMGTGAEGVQRAANAIQQMNAAQKISAEDLNQLRDAGIPVYDLLSKALGKSKKQVSGLVQAGKLGKPALDKMMSALTSGKGLERFNGLMEKQSASLAGMWSTVQDTFGQGLAKAIAPSLPLIKSGLDKVSKFMGPALQTIGKGISKGLSAVFGKGGLIDDVRNLWQSVQPYFAQIGANLEKIFGPSLSSAQGALGKLHVSFDQIERAAVNVTSGLANFSGWIAKNKGLIEGGAVTIGVLAGGLKLVAIQQKATAAGGFVKWIAGVVKSTKLWAAAQAVLNVIMDANPIGLVVIAVAALAAGFYVAYKKSATFRKIVQEGLHAVQVAAQAVAHWFTGSFVPFFTKTLPGAFRSGFDKAKKIWSGITSAVTAPMKLGEKGVSAAWSDTKKSFSTAKNWVGGTWRRGWSAAKGWIHDPVGSARTAISNSLGARGVRAAFSTLDSWGQKIFGRRWAGMKAKLTQPIQNARDYLKKVFGPGGGGVRQIFSDAVTAIGRIFAKIRGALLAPIRSAIGVINTGLIKGGINWILNKIGVPKSKQIPWIPVPRFAEGGRSIGRGGQRGGKDRILALVDHGEMHVKERSTRALDRQLPGGLDYMNRTGKWPVGPAAETYGANEQASRGQSLPIKNIAGLPGNVVDLVRRGPRPGEPAGYGANPLGFAASEVGHGGWYNRCLAFVNAAWNYTVGRFRLATARQSAMAGPRTMSGTAPAGAAGYWDTGPAGHVALSAGDGTYYSNDVITPGIISRVRKAVIDRWGPFMGWWSPTGAKGVPGAPGGLLSGVWNFLKGLSPLKWLQNKAAAVAGAIPGVGMFGSALKRIPPFLISRAGSRLMDMITNGGGQWFDSGRGVLPTGTSIVHNGTGKPEPLVNPNLIGGAQTIIIKVEGTGHITRREADMIAQALLDRTRANSGVKLSLRAA